MFNVILSSQPQIIYVPVCIDHFRQITFPTPTGAVVAHHGPTQRSWDIRFSMIVPVVLVWCPRCWKVVGNLCSTGMWPGQRTCEVDTAAGNLHASRVRSSQWRSDCNCSAAEAPNRGNNGRLRVRP